MSGLMGPGLLIVAIIVVGVVSAIVGAALEVSRGSRSRRRADAVDGRQVQVQERQREMCGTTAGARNWP